MSAQHTAEEWEAIGSDRADIIALAKEEFSSQVGGECLVILDKDKRTIAYMGTTPETLEKDKANAALTAAAPDLLAAAEMALQALQDALEGGEY